MTENIPIFWLSILAGAGAYLGWNGIRVLIDILAVIIAGIIIGFKRGRNKYEKNDPS